MQLLPQPVQANLFMSSHTTDTPTTQQFTAPSFRRQRATEELGNRVIDDAPAHMTTTALPTNFVGISPHHMTSEAMPTQHATQSAHSSHAMRRVSSWL